MLSVITPAYNSSTFIGETLGSVFAQTFTNFEVIAAKMARLTPNNWRVLSNPIGILSSISNRKNHDVSVAIAGKGIAVVF